MKKVILILVLLLFPIILMSSVLAFMQSNDEKVSIDKCEYTNEVTKNAKLEEVREYVNQRVYASNLVNVVLGIYADDEYDRIDEIIHSINQMYEYGINLGADFNEETYIQSYKYGKGYLKYLYENDLYCSLKNNKNYQKDILGYEDENENINDYKFYLSILSKITNTCAVQVDGFPIDRPYVISGWLPTYNKNGTGGKHYGIDFAIPIGSNVYAIADAEVIATNNNCDISGGYIGSTCGGNAYEGSGNYVQYKFEKDEKVYYVLSCHLSQADVNVGDLVSVGQKIGLSGNSGNSSGAHMHLEIHEDTKRVGSEQGLINACDMIDTLCEDKE